MNIQVYNTLTGKKEEFKTLKPKEVKMYVCGPTVYNYIHLGNARMAIVFDTVRRYLEYVGYKVEYVSNFTDVDDKMIKAAKEMNEDLISLADRFISCFHEDVRAVNVKEASVHPRVTENMPEIIDFIRGLINKGYAYYSNGDVYFNANKFKNYGNLSKQPIENLRIGERVEVGELKRDPLDFTLWKQAKTGEIYWKSPWGNGRPGWHIECSAMVQKYLGTTIDIHAGGKDLCFPHHENEIAQSEALTGKKMATYWLHNGYVNVDNEKMSKSLGNFKLLRDLTEIFEPAAIRLYILMSHYRNPINFSDNALMETEKIINKIKNTISNLEYRKNITPDLVDDSNKFLELKDKYSNNFIKEMNDDFNTPNAISVLLNWIKEANLYLKQKNTSIETLNIFISLIDEFLNVLGIELKNNSKVNNLDELSSWIKEMIAKRQEAKRNRDYEFADKIREELKDKNVILEDTIHGTRWKIKF